MALAARQQGCVSTGQLLAAGLTRDGIAHRVRIGWMMRRHRGVFVVGPLASPLTELVAALLACGPGAALSHLSAAARLGLCPAPAVVDVSVPGNRRARAGVRVHRVTLIDATELDGLRVTTAERRLLRLIEKADLPIPRTNVRLHGHEVDFHWPDHRLVVKVDGFQFHSTREAFERGERWPRGPGSLAGVRPGGETRG